MKRKQDAPYLEMGEYFQKLRQTEFTSALALFKEPEIKSKFTFSYSKYADFERGVVLPAIDEVLQITKFFKAEEAEAALLWAKVQMPVALKEHFHYDEEMHKTRKYKKRESSAEDMMQNLDTTWVFGPLEKEVFDKNPHLIDVVLKLVTNFPKAVPLAALGGLAIREDLKKLEALGRIHESHGEITITNQFFYIPKTKEWQTVRYKNMRRALQMTVPHVTLEQVKERKAMHSMVTTLVPRSLLGELIDQIKAIETKLIECESDYEDELYSFIGVLAPRKLDPTQK